MKTDDILKLQTMFESGEISETDLTEQEKEQLCELYEKQCKDIENDTRKTLRKLSMTFFEIIANIVERHCDVKKSDIRLNTPIRWELGKYSHPRRKMFGEVESAFSILISNEEAENVCTVEDLLNLVLEKKGVLDLR